MSVGNRGIEIVKEIYAENAEHIGVYIDILTKRIEAQSIKIRQLTEERQRLLDFKKLQNQTIDAQRERIGLLEEAKDLQSQAYESQKGVIKKQEERIKQLEDLLEEYKKISEALGYKVFKTTGKKIYKF